MNNWSITGYFIAVLWIVTFSFRYLAIYPDYSQAITFIGTGLIIFCFSWIYEEFRKQNKRIEHLDNILTDLETYIVEKKKWKNKNTTQEN